MADTAAALPDETYDDDEIRRIMRECRTIAMVGASANWNRPSFFAMKYLQEKGYLSAVPEPLTADGLREPLREWTAKGCP